jgi:hypothetical protein
VKLPNSDNASLPQEKITDYLLSPSHRDGRHKAAFFTAFGFTLENWQQLATALLHHANEHEVAREENSPFGKRYVIEGIMRRRMGERLCCGQSGLSNQALINPALSRPTRCGGKTMIKELDTVVLTDKLPEHGLQPGDIGTVVLAHDLGGYEVEFMTLDGETIAVVSLGPQQVRPVGRGEIAQARPVAAG